MRILRRRLALAAHHLATSGETLVYLAVAALVAVASRLLVVAVVVGALALVLLAALATVPPAPAGASQGCPLCACTVRKGTGR